VRDGRGNTAPHYLAVGLAEQFQSDEQRRLCRLFLDLDVNVNVRNGEGRTALFALFDDDGIRAKMHRSAFGYMERNGSIPSADEVE
jgi:hypothetical protein